MKIMLIACLAKNKAGNIFGGAEKSIINLANWLADKNEVILVSVEGNERPFHISDKVLYEGFAADYKNKIQQHISIMKNTKKSIKKHHPDIAISFWVQPLFYMLVSGAKRNIRMIYSERNDPHREYSRITRTMRKIVLDHTEGIVFQTNDAKAYFDRKIQDRSTVIHNPVYMTADQYPVPTKRDNRLVAVGRLNNQKNYKLLIRGFSEIANLFPEIVLEIYGEGPLKEELQCMIDEMLLSDRIKLMGGYPNVIDKIYGARMFVMTSIYEGMPNALMEAMCLGIPALCSNCPTGGPKELINSGHNGYLFKNDDVNDLVEKMKFILNLDETEIKKLSENEKSICITHSADNIFSEWMRYIERVYEYRKE